MISVFDEYAEEKVQEREKELELAFQEEKKELKLAYQQRDKEKDSSTASRLLKKGLSIEAIAEVFPSLSVDVIKQLKQQLPQA